MLEIIDNLMGKGAENLTAEEDVLLDLLIDLVHDFEEKRYPLPPSPSHRMVAFLLEQRGLKPSALWPVLGSKSRVSDLLLESGRSARIRPRSSPLSST